MTSEVDMLTPKFEAAGIAANQGSPFKYGNFGPVFLAKFEGCSETCGTSSQDSYARLVHRFGLFYGTVDFLLPTSKFQRTRCGPIHQNKPQSSPPAIRIDCHTNDVARP